MAISLKAAGSWAELTADGAVTIPGSPASGDRMFLFASWKDFSVTAQVSGWTEITEFADGSVSAGNGSGSMKVGCWYRDWQSGDGNPTLDFSSSPNIAGAVIQVWQKGATEAWNTPTFVTAAIAAASSITATSSSSLTVDNGAAIMLLIGIRDDSATFTRTATTAIEDDGSPNVTWNGNYVESPVTHLSTTTGFDMAADLGYRLVTTGGAGVNLTLTGTLSASETGAALWVHQSVFTPETHSGTLTGTGGGTATVASQKNGQTALSGTGGGAAELPGAKQGQAAVSGTASGAATFGVTTDRNATLAGTGSGAAELPGHKGALALIDGTGGGSVGMGVQSERSGALTTTGGGTAAFEVTADRGTTVSASGGGQITLSVLADRRSDLVVTGAGTFSFEYTVEFDDGPTGVLVATGGGIVTLIATAGRQAGLGITGGGAATVSGTSGRTGTLSLTGGGTVDMEGSQEQPFIPLSVAGVRWKRW